MSNETKSEIQYDGITQIAADRIIFEGREYVAGTGILPGVVQVSGNFLHGSERRQSVTGSVWLRPGEIRGPNYGPAWEGQPYIPTPEYALEQWQRSIAGLPLMERYKHRERSLAEAAAELAAKKAR